MTRVPNSTCSGRSRFRIRPIWSCSHTSPAGTGDTCKCPGHRSAPCRDCPMGCSDVLSRRLSHTRCTPRQSGNRSLSCTHAQRRSPRGVRVSESTVPPFHRRTAQRDRSEDGIGTWAFSSQLQPDVGGPNGVSNRNVGDLEEARWATRATWCSSPSTRSPPEPSAGTCRKPGPGRPHHRDDPRRSTRERPGHHHRQPGRGRPHLVRAAALIRRRRGW